MKSILQTLMSIVTCLTLASCSTEPQEADSQNGSRVEMQQGTYTEASPDAFNALWKNKEGMLLDVRTPEEFEEAHLPGAKVVDYLNDDFISQMAALPRDTTFLLYCQSGRRSQMAGEELKKMGYDVVNLKGGIVGWSNEGYETVK